MKQNVSYMIRKRQFLYLLLSFSFIIACSDDDEGKKGEEYDPTKPVEVFKFMPDSAEFMDEFVILGENFGTDISKIQVLFEENVRKGIIRGSDGKTIYGLMPKQSDGDNSITLVLNDTDTIPISQSVHYTMKTQISVLTGDTRDRKFVDGTLANARFESSTCCVFVAEDNMIAVESSNNRIRLISESEDQVITLLEGFHTGKPAVNKAKDRAYSVGTSDNSHLVYEFRRENLWAPRKIRATTISLSNAQVWSSALDDSEEWLYFVDEAGKMVRMNLEDTEITELIMQGIFSTPEGQALSTTRPYIVWSPVDKCFFVSAGVHGTLCVIYKIWEENGTWKKDIYAGILGRAGHYDAERELAILDCPTGMTVDSYGNLYFADQWNFVFRKIDHETGMVSRLAGSNRGFNIGSDPIEGTEFWIPSDIAADSEDNFMLADWQEGCWIKLAIE